jgi:hypothetical protein
MAGCGMKGREMRMFTLEGEQIILCQSCLDSHGRKMTSEESAQHKDDIAPLEGVEPGDALIIGIKNDGAGQIIGRVEGEYHD